MNESALSVSRSPMMLASRDGLLLRRLGRGGLRRRQLRAVESRDFARGRGTCSAPAPCTARRSAGAVADEVLGGEAVLGVAEARAAEQAGRHHADAAHDRHRDRPGPRETIADHGQHRRPEERLAERVDGERDHRAGERVDAADHAQADDGEQRRR